MEKTHALPDSITFAVSTTGTREYRLRLGIMSDAALVKLLTRGTRILCANATGAKDWTPAEKESAVLECIERYESGEYGSFGAARVSDLEKELRKAFETWLVRRGAKATHAAEVARNPDGVHDTFMAIVRDKGLSEDKAESMYELWVANAESYLAKLHAADDDLTTDESEETDESEAETAA